MTQQTELSDRSVGELVRLANEQIVSLVHHEVDFAKAEMAAKAKRAGIGAGLFGLAGVVALYALGVLVAAAILALALALPGWAAALIVGAALLLIAAVAVLVGRSRLRSATPAVPQESVRQLHDDFTAVRDAAKTRGRA
jgi:MFS family permease